MRRPKRAVLGRRTLTSVDRQVTAEVTIFMPHREGDDYFCKYSIKYSDDSSSKTGEAGGADAIQALQEVMYAIGASFPEGEGWTWAGPEEIGFPRPGDKRFPPHLLEGIDQATKKILSERSGSR